MDLIFDTCQSACSVALGKADGTVLAAKWEAMGRGHAERLVPMIEEVLAEAGAARSAISRILVCTGPGTFAGQRVGIATARALALALGVPAIGLTIMELMAAEWAANAAEGDPENLFVIFDARRNEAYVQSFRRENGKAQPQNEVAMINLDDLAAHLPTGPFALAGTGQHFVAEGTPTELTLPNARAGLYMAAQITEGANRLARPLYLRAPDADLPSYIPPQRGDLPEPAGA